MQWQFIFYLPFKTFRSKFYFSVELCQRPHVLPVYRKHFFSPVQNEARTLFCRFFVFLCSYFTNGCDKSSYWNIWFSSWKTGNARLHKFLISLTQSIQRNYWKDCQLIFISKKFAFWSNLFNVTSARTGNYEVKVLHWRILPNQSFSFYELKLFQDGHRENQLNKDGEDNMKFV